MVYDVIQDEESAATEKVLRQQEALVRMLKDGAEERQARRVLSIMRQNRTQAKLNETLNRLYAAQPIGAD